MPEEKKTKKKDKDTTDKEKSSKKEKKDESSDKKEKSEKKESKGKKDKKLKTDDEKRPSSPKKTSSKSKGTKSKKSPDEEKKPKKKKDDLQFDKLFADKAKEFVDNVDPDVDDEEDLPVDDGLVPIAPPKNPPMDTMTLTLKQPDLKRLTMEKIDPANTNIRMIREFLQDKYYKGHTIPRMEQRPLLYRTKPIFDTEGDYNINDAKTLADHGIVKDCTIDLAPMHVYVISPSTGKSMVINNVDPMNDSIMEMRKLALEDGYPIEKLRVLHKEAKNKEIEKSQNSKTFFDCSVKHNHTLVLEWPKIVIKVKIPLPDISDDSTELECDEELLEENGHRFKLIDFHTQTELDKVDVLSEFICGQTGIPKSEQVLVSPKLSTKSKNKPPKLRKLSESSKVIADYELVENDIIELVPRQLKINLVGAGEKKQTIFDQVYPNDTIETIKARIAKGEGEKDGIPAIPKTNLGLRKSGQTTDLKRESMTLHEANIKDGDELDMEKTKITIKVQLPEGKSGHKTNILEIGVNPKVDDMDTVKLLISDQTGLPVDYLPSFLCKDEIVNGSENKTRKLMDYNIVEDDVLKMRPIVVNVNIPGDLTICLDNVDPFNDTIDDLKNRLGPDDLDVMPVEKQRLMFNDMDLDKDTDDSEESDSDDCASRRLFECHIKDSDILDLECSKIDVTIRTPNGDYLLLVDVDPRGDTLEVVKDFLNTEYYQGKQNDGSIPEDQLRPLVFEDTVMDDEDKSLRDYGFRDDDHVIEMKPMTVYVVVGTGDNEEKRVLDSIDPMKDDVQNVKLMTNLDDDVPMDKWSILHKESDMKELEDIPDASTFYDHGVCEGHTLMVRRKPIIVRVRFPYGIVIKEDIESNIEVEDQGIAIKIDPDTGAVRTIKQYIFDAIGFPVVEQRLNKVLPDSSREALDAPGAAKLSSPEVNITDDCTIELAPLTIHVKDDKGKVTSVDVLPFDTIETVKKRLESRGLKIPASKQRLLGGDLTEYGGDEKNRQSLGSDESTLAELGVRNGQPFTVEKSKISLTVKMPNGMGNVEVVVDPKIHSVDQIRDIIEEKKGLPKGYQQRFALKGKSLDDGFRQGGNQGAKKRLSTFGVKENDVISLEATAIWVIQLPKKEKYLIQSIDPMKETLFDLKKRAAGKTMVHVSKQRMLNSKTLEEYVGGKDDTKKLYEYEILDGDEVLMEKAKLSFYIVLPSLERLDMTIDARYDDLQMIRDYLKKKYYDKRDLPKEHLRSMTRGVLQVLDDEPGDKKLMDFGIVQDDDHVKLKPCFITIDTPTKIIHCPNADPFHDTLSVIQNFVLEVGKVNVDGLAIEFDGKEMTDYTSVLYDLGIKEDAKVFFK